MESLPKRFFGGANPSPNERWVDHKPALTPKPKGNPPTLKDHIHKRNGEYWFGNKPVKYLIRKAREQGLIVSPKDHKE